MLVEITPITIANKPILANLLELYQHDLSEIDGREFGSDGRYGYTYLDHYWTEEGRHPFFLRVDGAIAGFALVRIVSGGDGRPEIHMAEFFILRKYRRRGVGEGAASQLFDLFPGLWIVPELEGNLAAQQFWRRVIGRYTGGIFVEAHEGAGADSWVVQRFRTPSGSRNARRT
jgi:predicted acetyltransferase